MTKSETQLTLQDLDKILDEYYSDRITGGKGNGSRTTAHRRAVRRIENAFTQALTSLKREMEKRKKDEEITGLGRYYRGKAEAHNYAISECQRVLERWGKHG